MQSLYRVSVSSPQKGRRKPVIDAYCVLATNPANAVKIAKAERPAQITEQDSITVEPIDGFTCKIS